MNYTKSGIIAVGAPFSRMRFLGEALRGLENPALLLLTEEGNDLANRYFRSIGCAPEEMPEEVKAETLENHPSLFQFLTGLVYALEME